MRRIYRVGQFIRVREQEEGNDRRLSCVNEYKIVKNYPLFIVCERPGKNDKSVTIRTTFSKWDLEHEDRIL